ncbi:hypothetical protein V499_05978 [Pseudogymnoascus sp. VKM F-103]|nr:hypothetical protein V499_05978 [Pseudogymnoascus sp. VKM F-103]
MSPPRVQPLLQTKGTPLAPSEGPYQPAIVCLSSLPFHFQPQVRCKISSKIPKYSAEDVPTYFHSDLLNRHIALSHSKSPVNLELSSPASFLTPEPKQNIENNVQTKSDHERRELALRRLSDSMMISLGAEFAQASNRKLLEQLYFSTLHLHWPILHERTFQSEAQPEQLVQAVLVAGLWMTGTAKARQQAEFHHDKIVEIQAASGIPSNVIDNKRLLRLTVYSKRLFRLFSHAGVFDQQRINAENPLNPLVREQYQRLAVILFKATVHLNAVLITHLPKFRLLDYFDPAMLNVRVPSSQEIWNASSKDYSQDVHGRALIGSLFIGDTDNRTYQTLTSISACDFSAGMILGCFNKRQPDEPLLDLVRRISPFLAWHFNVQDNEEVE